MRAPGLLALAAAAALSIGTAAPGREPPAREPPARAAAAHAALVLAEREYADWLDATSAVSTAGLR